MHDGFVYSTGFGDEAGYMVLLQSTVDGETLIHEYFHLQDEKQSTIKCKWKSQLC